jgi:hypothetical protein
MNMPRQKKKAVEEQEPSGEILQHKKRAFLSAYVKCGNITKAASSAKIARQTHYDWMRDDPEYPKLFADAEIEAGDELEYEARKRALAGSDTLMIFLLKGIKPEKYKDRVESNNTNHNTTQDITQLSPEERRARIDELNRRRGNGTHSAAGG